MIGAFQTAYNPAFMSNGAYQNNRYRLAHPADDFARRVKVPSSLVNCSLNTVQPNARSEFG
jgi:hypothetical protein